MEGTNFWLIYIRESLVTVALVNQSGTHYHVVALGPSIVWDINSEANFINAVDESLSGAALNAHISEDQEPVKTAFVVPPFWVEDKDGKISSPKLKLIKSLCKEIDLIPSGFLSEDEAIVEEANQKDDFPASFILVHLDEKEFYLSLVYLGHIKERIRKKIDQPFNGQTLESALLELNSQSALPPQIILFGVNSQNYSEDIKNFPWVGKKDIETFLHFPEVKIYQENDIINIFAKIITAQIENPLIKDEPVEEIETTETIEPITQETLEEVDANNLGFSSENNHSEELFEKIPPENPPLETKTLPSFYEEVTQTNDSPVNTEKTKPSLSFLKKIKFPKIKFKNLKIINLLWIFLILLSISFCGIFFLSKTEITLFLTPYSFEKSVPVTLSVNADIDKLSQSIIPVEKKDFDVEASSEISTTGEKTVGNKAKGEITVYNKSDKKQSLSNGTILVDSSGKKFELTTNISIASSSSNLDEGVINLGQTKTSIIATDIGSEYNISKDSQLSFEKVSSDILIARVTSALTGGSKEQVLAVSSEDKSNIETQIDQEIAQKIEEKISNGFSNVQGIVLGTTQISKDKIELSREVGEQASELSGSVKASVSVFTISDQNKEEIIKYYLSDEADFNQITADLSDFKFTFSGDEIKSQQSTGTLTISGSATPNVDLASLKKSLLGKTTSKAASLIKKMVTRAYNFTIKNNLPLNVLPFRDVNLSIQVQSKSL